MFTELMHRKTTAKQRAAARRNIKKARCVARWRRKGTKLATARKKCHVKGR